MSGKKPPGYSQESISNRHASDSLATLAALSGAMAIMTLSPAGIILAANDNVVTILQAHHTQLVGHNYRSLFPPGNQQIAEDVWARVAAGQTHAQCIPQQTLAGNLIWLDASFIPVMDQHAHVDHIIVLQSDASDRVAMGQQWQQEHHLLGMAIHASENAILILDRDKRIVFHNEGAGRLLGLVARDVMGQRPEAVFHTQPAIIQAIDVFTTTPDNRHAQRTQVRIQDRHQRPLWISLMLNPIIDTHGALVHMVCIFTDITSLKMRELLQYKAFDAMARDATLSHTMAMVCQEIDDIAPETLCSFHQLDDQRQLHTLAGPSLPATYHDIAMTHMARANNTSSQTWYIDQPVSQDQLEQDPLWDDYKHRFVPTGLCAAWMTLVHSADGQAIGLVVMYCFEAQRPTAFQQQLTALVTPIFALAMERETTRSRIEKLAYHDALTGLANRSLVKHLASEAMSYAANTDSSIAFLFIDLDRFKQVNDSLGHHAGDELLRTIAARLTSVARKSDIVGRLSGDEFIVVLTHCHREIITDIASRIQQALAAPCHINGVAINPSASIGISIYPDDGNTIDILLHRADLAMYKAKETGRGSFGFFSADMDDHTRDTLAMEAALRTALHNQSLSLHYQPQVHLETQRLYGVEALARWEHPEWGPIAPDIFIGIAQECGLIGQFSDWVLEQACRQLAHWHARHVDVPCIAINLSASNFHDKALANTISGLLARYQLPAHAIKLEITETVLMDTHPETIQNILDIHDLGIRFAIDDFGTGYSSLSYLRNLPVSELKLDKSFVRDITTDPTVLALANAVIRIGESLGLAVIAEGVEEPGQYALLKDSQCDVAQGYLFCPPLPANALEHWIHDFATGNVVIGQGSQRTLF